jgi:hypothetical protein
MREPDMAGYDARSVVDYLLKADCNAIVVNAGGIVDFFPIEGKLRRSNPFGNGIDVLQSLTEQCHKHGIAVIARVDFRGVEKERYEL